MITSTNRNNPAASTTDIPVKYLSNQQDQKILKKKFNYSSQQFDDVLPNNSDFDDYTSINENTLRNIKHQKQYKTIESSFDQPSFTSSYNDSNKTENIFYVKQKYKMYLDWLDENYNSNSKSSFQHTQQKPQILNIKNVNNNFFNNILKPPVATATTQITSTQSAVDVSNLNWYKFETSLLNQNQNQPKPLKPRSPKNDYFSNLTNRIQQNRQQQQQVNHNIFENLAQSNQLPQIFLPNKGKVTKSKKSNNTRVKRNDDSSNETSALSMNNPSSLSMNRISSPDEYFEHHVNSKAVKFDSNLLSDVKSPGSTRRKTLSQNITSTNFKTPKGTTPHLPLKPILKSTLNSDSIIKRPIANKSPPTTASSDYHNYNNLDSTSINRFNRNNFNNSNNSNKLPPLTDSIKQKQNCSDDFLAVINDMEKSRLV